MIKLQKKHSTKQLGFTMIELLVVATIIILLTTIGIISYRQASISSRDGKRKADLETVRQALVLYRSENGSYPSGDFPTIVNTLNNLGYLSDGIDRFEDPGQNTYVYTPTPTGCSSGNCTGFTLSVVLEKDGATAYTLRNP